MPAGAQSAAGYSFRCRFPIPSAPRGGLLHRPYLPPHFPPLRLLAGGGLLPLPALLVLLGQQEALHESRRVVIGRPQGHAVVVAPGPRNVPSQQPCHQHMVHPKNHPSARRPWARTLLPLGRKAILLPFRQLVHPGKPLPRRNLKLVQRVQAGTEPRKPREKLPPPSGLWDQTGRQQRGQDDLGDPQSPLVVVLLRVNVGGAKGLWTPAGLCSDTGEVLLRSGWGARGFPSAQAARCRQRRRRGSLRPFTFVIAVLAGAAAEAEDVPVRSLSSPWTFARWLTGHPPLPPEPQTNRNRTAKK
eukprot:RCo005030